jgi:hypothetical protein
MEAVNGVKKKQRTNPLIQVLACLPEMFELSYLGKQLLGARIPAE